MIGGNRPDHGQPIRIGVRQCTQQQRIHEAEDYGVRSNRNSQRQNGNGCEPWIAAQNAKPICDIANQIAEYAGTPNVESAFANGKAVPELQTRFSMRLLAAHADADIVVFQLLQVKVQLLINLAVDSVGGEHGFEATPDTGDWIHFNLPARLP